VDLHFLDLGTSWRWEVDFTPLTLYHRSKNPGTHGIGDWASPKAGLDNMEKWKFLTLSGLELQPLSRSAQVSRYTDSATMHNETENKTGFGIKMFQNQIKQTPEDTIHLPVRRTWRSWQPNTKWHDESNRR
jgi:hypothetical protein